MWLVPALGGLAVLLHHAAWFKAFPQYQTYPPDQAGYMAGGRALIAIAATILHQGLTSPLIEELRRWFDFLGVAVLYGAIDFIRPNDLAFARGVFAFFNALAAVGAWSLARRLASPFAGLLALAFFVVSPAFPSGASRLYSDAVTGCLIVWSVRLFLDGGRRAMLAGLLAGAAMLVRVQLLPWVPLSLAAFTVAASILRVDHASVRRIRLGWLGLLLPLMAFGLLTTFGLENRNDSAPKHNLPRYHYYAYGFWQYLESDGWEGPWRLKQDPFYLEMVAASSTDPDLLRSRPRQYLFAAHYVAARLPKAIPIVLGNAYRIFNRPQNPEHRGFISDRAATGVHRLALLAAIVASVHLWTMGSAGLLAPALILSLGGFHALAWGWPRYAMPVLPVLIALSGVGIEIVLRSFMGQWRRWFAVVVVLGLVGLTASSLRDWAPEAAWSLRILVLLGGIAAFVVLSLTSSEPRPSRRAVALSIILVSLVVFGDAWRDASWHTIDLSLRPGDVVRQEIRVSSLSLARLREARERFLAVDLELTDPSKQPWPATVNGLPVTLLPTIPPLPESIPVPDEGRAYPQWWSAHLSDAMLERATETGVFSIELEIDDPTAAVLKADRFADQSTVFEAPSLGDWPYAAGIKPEYDRDFRLVERKALDSLETKTWLVRNGASSFRRSVARIRIFELDDRSGRVLFEMKKTPGAKTDPVQTAGFAARAAMRDRGDAEVNIGGASSVRFRVATFKNTTWTSGAFTLCYRDQTPNRKDAYDSRGIYLLSGPLPCSGDACRVEVRFWPGMDDRPMSFITEPPRTTPTMDTLREAAEDCSLPGPIQWTFDHLVDGTTNSYPADRGRWRVARIY